MAAFSDFSADDVVNSDDLASSAAAESVVNTTAHAAVETVRQESVIQPTDSMDSGVVERALQGVPGVEEVVQEATGEEDETPEVIDSDPGEKKVSPYSKRVQKLVSERNAEREARLQERQQFERERAQYQAQQRNEAYQAEQLAYQRAQYEMMQAQRLAADEANLSDVERARRKFATEIREDFRREMSPEWEQTRQELEQLKAERAQMRQAFETKQRLDRIEAEQQSVLNNQLFKKYDPADVTAMKDEYEEMFAAYCAAFRMRPEEAAPRFAQFANRVARAEMKATSKANGSKVAQSRAVPAPVPGGKAGGVAGGIQWPALDKLRAKGIESHVDWLKRGRPAV
jgi:hypothetical protein